MKMDNQLIISNFLYLHQRKMNKVFFEKWLKQAKRIILPYSKEKVYLRFTRDRKGLNNLLDIQYLNILANINSYSILFIIIMLNYSWESKENPLKSSNYFYIIFN
jgi:hypothetical protein